MLTLRSGGRAAVCELLDGRRLGRRAGRAEGCRLAGRRKTPQHLRLLLPVGLRMEIDFEMHQPGGSVRCHCKWLLHPGPGQRVKCASVRRAGHSIPFRGPSSVVQSHRTIRKPCCAHRTSHVVPTEPTGKPTCCAHRIDCSRLIPGSLLRRKPGRS